MEHHELGTTEVRMTVWNRQGGLCLRCGHPMHSTEWEAHHRRRRRLLGWCPCNIVGLHPRCHTMGELAVHDNPEQARRMGLIVPSFGPEPRTIPLQVHWPWVGPGLLGCDGMVYSTLAPPDWA